MSDTHTTVGGPGTGGDRRAQVQEWTEAYNSRDAARLASCYSPDAVLHLPEFLPDPLRGRSAIQHDQQVTVTGFPDIEVHPLELVVDGATAAIRALVTATHTGPLQMPGGELPATGRRLEMPMAVFTHRGEDGLIVEEYRYYDLAGFAAQLGADQ